MKRTLVAGRRCIALAALFSLGSSATATPDARPAELARRGYLGAEVRATTLEERETHRLKGEEGVHVDRVLPESAATAADLRAGDILVSLDGRGIGGLPQFIEALSACRSGAPLRIALIRDGEGTTKEVVLKPRPTESSDAYRVIYGSVVSRGRRLRTIVTRPRDDGKHPALFLIQGLGSFSIEATPGGAGAYGRIIDDFARLGFVTIRVDKPGQGDSEGGPTRDMDFETELDGYRQALRALKGFDFVDPARVILFGHSMGGVMGPLLGAEIPVRGIAAYGTIARTWHEYTLENTRRQRALAGSDFAEIDRTLRKDAAIDLHLGEGLSPPEIAARHPELKGRVDDWYAEGKYHAATHYDYFRQLAGKNLAEAWATFDGHTLAAWGRSDYISGEEDHALIARIVNRARPGRGVFLAFDGIDHGFHRASSQEESFRRSRDPAREFNPIFHDALRDWASKVCGVVEPGP